MKKNQSLEQKYDMSSLCFDKDRYMNEKKKLLNYNWEENEGPRGNKFIFILNFLVKFDF